MNDVISDVADIHCRVLHVVYYSQEYAGPFKVWSWFFGLLACLQVIISVTNLYSTVVDQMCRLKVVNQVLTQV